MAKSIRLSANPVLVGVIDANVDGLFNTGGPRRFVGNSDTVVVASLEDFVCIDTNRNGTLDEVLPRRGREPTGRRRSWRNVPAGRTFAPGRGGAGGTSGPVRGYGVSRPGTGAAQPGTASPHFSYSRPAGRAQLAAARRRGRLGTPASGRHSPPKAGGGKDSPFRGGAVPAGISAFGGIRTWEWQTPFVTVRATCLRSVKADGKEPPAAQGVVVSSPTGKNPAAPSAIRHLICWGYVPRREPFRQLGSSPPRPCGPLCRPEAGVPSRPRHGAIGSTRSRAHPRCRCPVAAAFTATGGRSVSLIRHPVTAISARASRVTVLPVTRLCLLGVRSGPGV